MKGARSLRIAIAVPGRFHAFDLGLALLRRGHDVTLLTNYPKWAARRFGVPDANIRSFWMQGVLAKAAYAGGTPVSRPESWLNPLFGEWAASEIRKSRWDVVHAWSGVAEESYASDACGDALKLVMRGSAHIRTQSRLLEEEMRRTGAELERPDWWIEQREVHEYELADRIVVLSGFAERTFIEERVDPRKLRRIGLGADLRAFQASAEVVEARCRRILAGAPLRVLYVGALSLQKGLWDLDIAIRSVGQGRFHFELVGGATREAAPQLDALREYAAMPGKQPQTGLRSFYEQADLFVFPTIQDGFAVVLAQAQANALPIITTANCAGPDVIRDADTGWIVPIRSPESIVERLIWCDEHRPELAEAVQRASVAPIRTWDDVARDFETMCESELSCAAGAAIR